MGSSESKPVTPLEEKPEEPDTVHYAEFWMRPLESQVARTFGGKHSFVTFRCKNKKYWFIEKLHDGTVNIKPLSNSEYIRLKTTGLERRHVIHKKSIKKGITLKHVAKVAEEHHGEYHIHDANCHRLSTAIWNALLKDAIVQVPQQRLTKVCKNIGLDGDQHRSSRSGVP